MPRRAIKAGASPVISRPLNKIWPLLGSKNFVSRLKQVVFPAPFGPMRAWIAPRATLRFTSLTAENPLKDFPSPIVSSIVSCKLISSAL